MFAGMLLRSLAVGIWLWIPVTCVLAQERTRQEVLDDIMSILRPNPVELSLPDNGINTLIKELHWRATGPVTDSMRVFLETTAENPRVAQRTRWAAINALRLFPQEEELERVRRLLPDNDVNTTAAAPLVAWGFWDEGSPILLEKEAWPFLVDVGPRELVEPVLRNAAVNGCKSLLSQFGASAALSAYGDTLIKYETARDIFRRFFLDYEQPQDTSDLARVAEVAGDFLAASSADPEDVDLLEAAIRYPDEGIRIFAVMSIGLRARLHRDRVAVAALERAAESSPDPDVVEGARQQLGGIPKELKGVQR